MEFIETRPDIAYQLLISTAESLAAVANVDYEPDESDRLSTQVPLQQLASSLGLDAQRVRELALAASKGQRWLKRKFKKFLSDYCSVNERRGKDTVFLLPEDFCPPLEDFDKTLGRIYDARSGNLHAASPFPRSVSIGTSPLFEFRALPIDPLNPLEDRGIPSVVWFERVVSSAARSFLTKTIPTQTIVFTQ